MSWRSPGADGQPVMNAARPSGQKRRSLAGNTLWNLAGTLLPLLVGLAAVPALLELLGIERFGMLALIWMLTGYFGVLDLGLGRALTKLVAEQAEHVGQEELSRLIWTALALMAAFGVVGAVALALAAGPFVRVLLHVPAALETEAIGATWYLALSLPVTVVSTGLRGVIEGLHLFRLVNLIRLPLGILTFLAPLAVAVLTPDLALVSASLLGVRMLALALHAIACIRTLPALARATRPDRALCGRLLRFGGWLTVSNLVSPIMTYLDRFVIGATLSLAAVAYYATPYEFITKLWYVPFAFTGVLFPTFSSSIARRDPESAVLMVRSIAAVFVVIFPAVLLAVAFAREGLGLWLGEDFASHSYTVLKWLAAGVLVNSMALVVITFVLGAGRSDWVAKLHLAELPFYLAGLWWMLDVAGIVGAAIAWTVRVALDALVLLWMAHRAAPRGIHFPAELGLVVMIGLGVLVPAALVGGAVIRAIIVLIFAISLPAFLWRRCVRPRHVQSPA